MEKLKYDELPVGFRIFLKMEYAFDGIANSFCFC